MRVFGETHRHPIELDAVLVDQVVIGGVGAGEPYRQETMLQLPP
jgi:hypothetical protein